ncbi:hypothetical protein [Streptomyces hirsutus]|uniref:hypothetical protein n=1 Tax=Streptomyces hirsutus TaxID=35620 RepID=UPI003328AAFD
MQLAMSNDYAAIISGVIAAILVIGFVEVQAYAKAAVARMDEDREPLQGLLEELLTAMREGGEPTTEQLEQIREMADNGQLRRRLRRSVRPAVAGAWWAVVSTALVSAELLIILWAAIDKHGPARWVAWYSLLACAVGVLTLMALSMRRAVGVELKLAQPFRSKSEILALRRYIRLSFQRYWERQFAQGEGAETPQPGVHDVS